MKKNPESLLKKHKAKIITAKIITTVLNGYNNFEKLVEEVYGSDPEFVAREEANNYSSYEYDFSKYPHRDYNFVAVTKEKIQEDIRQGDFKNYSINQIIATLIDDGHIPISHYTIRVSW